MTLRPASRDWLLSRNLLAAQQEGSFVSALGVKYLRAALARKPLQVPPDIKEWLVNQPLLMPMVPGVQ